MSQAIQDIAEIKDHELFRRACAPLNRDDLRKVKAALESQSAALKRAIEVVAGKGGDPSGMEAARGHILRRVKYVDSLFIEMNRSNGHWLVKLRDKEGEGWVKMTVHPSSWLVEQLAAMNEGGEDIDSLSIAEVHPITEEQFNQLPENIEHIQK